jgi:two-component system sensor kinase FixL
MIVIIAVADWRIDADIPLGFLYLLPMLLLGRILTRGQICAAAILCTGLTEAFNGRAWTPSIGIPRDILTFAAFSGIGFFVYSVVRSRKAAADYTHRIEREIDARQDAEEQMKFLIESSPAAIFTADPSGLFLLANEAAHKLLAVVPGSLAGTSIHRYFPSMVSLPPAHSSSRSFRTVMQCHGTRNNGEVFLADVWFSTYQTTTGARLAAMVVDISEDLRTHEESSLHQLLAGSRILVAAVSHEIRNVCAAIAIVHQNLRRSSSLENNKDFVAFGTLIESLEKIAAMNLHKSSSSASNVDLRALLDELRIIVGPALEEQNIQLTIAATSQLPEVLADRPSLMQVFLNLIKNSERALQNRPHKQLRIEAEPNGSRVFVRVLDTGPGVASPHDLFKPFQQRAESTGLGLYLSRAFMRSFQGDLRFEPSPAGACFVVELSTWLEKEAALDASADSYSDRR